MTKANKMHLESVTAENLMDFKEEAFISMASSSGSNGTVNLGINAYGKYVVKTKTETFVYDVPHNAINKYSEFLK